MTNDAPVLQSFVAGRWVGGRAGAPLASAVDGRTVFHTHADAVDFAAAADYARRVGVPALLDLDFQQRAAIVKSLAAHVLANKERLYAVSAHTGATRSDSWVDVDGGAGTLHAYASLGAAELPAGNVVHEGPVLALGKHGGFAGTHVLVPRGGFAVHVNAYNFPVWGLLEKFAPSFLAGLPCIVKPATATSYLTHELVRLIDESQLLPDGALQLVVGPLGDLLDRVDGADVVTFTGSADTAARLRVHPNLVRHAVPFNAEADSLNAAILAPDVGPDQPEFDLFVREVVREMTVKAGQKCTAIRRAIVPRSRLDAVADALRDRLASVVVGDPAVDGVRMGPLASTAQRADVADRAAQLKRDADVVYDGGPGFAPRGDGTERGAFFAPTLLRARDAAAAALHDVEAFGPVATLLGYDGVDDAVALAARGRGSLVSTLVTADTAVAARVVPALARCHGRVLVLDRTSAAESTGHGSPLPGLKHGGPGRAGGGEELGGIRAVRHLLQRCAVQGSPTVLAAVAGEHVRGAAVRESPVHPFRKTYDDLQVGDALTTHRRTVTEADIVAFGCLSGDHFYLHFDAVAAADSAFGQRIAHGYFVLAAAAGLFVSPAPGPVLANLGIDALRFVKPVLIGDTIQARLTCKRKTPRPSRRDQPAQGTVTWDVQVTNQHGDVVAAYDVLTLVARGDNATPAARS